MELPKIFSEYDYIIEVIRKFVDPDYLKTKKSQLKWYCINYFNLSPYLIEYGIFNIDKYITNEYVTRGELNLSIFDTDKCTKIVKDPFTQKIIEGPFTLTKKDVINLMANITDSIHNPTIPKILISIIFPINSSISNLIEKQYCRNIYPIDKNLLLDFASPKFIYGYQKFFMDAPLIKNVDRKYVVIKNITNDITINIPINLFNLYCGIYSSIEDFDDYKENSIITVPFEFGKASESFLLKCINRGKIGNLCKKFNNNDIELKQFTRLLSFLQIFLV